MWAADFVSLTSLCFLPCNFRLTGRCVYVCVCVLRCHTFFMNFINARATLEFVLLPSHITHRATCEKIATKRMAHAAYVCEKCVRPIFVCAQQSSAPCHRCRRRVSKRASNSCRTPWRINTPTWKSCARVSGRNIRVAIRSVASQKRTATADFRRENVELSQFMCPPLTMRNLCQCAGT